MKADLKVRLYGPCYGSSLQSRTRNFVAGMRTDVEADLSAYAKAMADPP